MKYRELLELYRSGQLEEERRLAVEADIEKQDAISEYLCEEGEIPGLEDLSETAELPDSEKNDRLTTAIQKSIRRAFVKFGVIVGLVVLVITLLVIFVLPHAVDQFFYQPNTIAAANAENKDLTTNQMSLDTSVFTELFLPGRHRTNVTAIPHGYGVYDVNIQQNASPDGRFTTLSGHLVRNKLTLYDPYAIFRLPSSNAFMLPEGKDNNHLAVYIDEKSGEEIPFSRDEERKTAFDNLRRRTGNDLLVAYISLDKLTDYSDFIGWYEALSLNHFDAWAGIYAEDANGFWATPNTGISLTPSGMCIDWDREKYPVLSLLDNDDPSYSDASDEELMTTHFLSLMRYLDDHPQVSEVFGHPYGGQFNPEAAQEYVQQNGLEVYGLSLVASRDELLKLESDPAVSFLSVTPY